MSAIASVATSTGLVDHGAINRLEKRAVEPPEVVRSSTAGQSGRGALTVDQLGALRRSLERLAAIEVNRVERVATVGLAPVAAYDIGIRDAVREALSKLTQGTYGDCGRCRRPIPIVRLHAVPYARRCVDCQKHEESGWDQVAGLVGGVVRVMAGEPQGRSEAGA
jgi:hypothetical protein